MKHLTKLVFCVALLGTLLGLIARAAASVETSGGGVTFKLDASTWTERPKSVSVAGDFNGWNTGATPLSDPDGDNVWTATVKDVAEGKHQYKFVVDGDRWITDPSGDKELETDDTYGGKNSGFVAGPDVRKAPSPKANTINAEFIRHDASDARDAAVIDTNRVRLRVRTQRDDVQRVSVNWSQGDAKGSTNLVKLKPDGGYDVWSGVIGEPADIIIEGRRAADGTDAFSYQINLYDGDDATGDSGILRQSGYKSKPSRGNPFDYGRPFRVTTGSVDVPDWSHHAVWYQIFVDRFRNGNPDNDPGRFSKYERLVPWNGDWFATLPGEAAGEENFYEGKGNVWMRRYGGDLQGVREKLPYLRSLGVNAIYLNPVFEAESMHKYDTADYRHVDDNFGVDKAAGENHDVYPYTVQGETDDPATWKFSESDKLFLDFIKEAHAQGFHVVIDGVFNHVGTGNYLFQDVLKNGKKSKYADWFEVTDWGDGTPGSIQYNAWDKKSGALPVFKKDAKLGLAQGPRDYIFAITKRWLDPDGDPSTRDGIDGWRLDVPGDIPHPFWKDWRKVVKAANPDAYIVGEVWTAAQPWLQGDEFDAVMNYQFAMAAVDFFVDENTATKPSTFAARLEELVNMYPRPIALAQQNLFDSHDTDRVASMFANPDRPYDGANRLQDNAKSFAGPPYSPAAPTRVEWKRLEQAVDFQQAFLGAPMTYYGDEAGMWSPDDPSNRQPYPWPDRGPYAAGAGVNGDVLEHFRRAIAVRRALPALQTGDYATVLADDATGVVAFARTLGDDRATVVLNRSGAARKVTLDLPDGRYVDYLDPTMARLDAAGEGEADRPRITAISADISAEEGKMTVSLEPWQTRVLVRQ